MENSYTLYFTICKGLIDNLKTMYESGLVRQSKPINPREIAVDNFYKELGKCAKPRKLIFEELERR